MAWDGCGESAELERTGAIETAGNAPNPENAAGMPRSGKSFVYPLAVFAGIILLMLLAAI